MAKRRRFTPEFKVQVVLELLSGSKTMAQVCRRYRLLPQVVSAWRQHFLERATDVFCTPESQRAEQQRIADLERMVGRLTMELEVAKKASSILTSHWTGNGR